VLQKLEAMPKQIFALIIFLFSTLFAFSQTSQFTGKVSNNKNEPLAGATILLVEAGRQITTDADGRFVLTLENGKKYSITISNSGYASKTITEIALSANADNNFIEIILENSSKNDLTGVTVVASSRRQENTNALIAFQRNNTSLSSGLAADFIRRTPDKNTGEVLRRVSGTSIQDNKFVIIRGLSDRYNSAYINGAILPSSEPDKKAFSFDVIPSTLIDNIIINKTATPDLTGEFAGGLVQIKTKDIPTSNQLIIGFSLGFNTQSAFEDFTSNTRGENDWLGFSDRSLTSAYPRKYLAYAQLPTDERLNIARSFNDRSYDEVNSTAGPIQQYNLTWANVKRYKNGAALGSILGLTYRNSKLLFDATKTLFERGNNGQAFFDYNDQQNKYSVNAGGIANLAWTYKKNKIAFKNLFNQLLEDNYYNRSGINTENLQDVRLRSSVLNQRSLYSAQLEGTHELPIKNIKWEWNLNFSINDKSQPDLRVQTYGKSIGVNEPFRINLRGNNTNRFYSELNDKAFGYTTSFTMPFEMGGKKQSLKVGGSSTIRLRDFKAFIFGFSEPADQSLNTLPFNQIFNNENLRAGGFNMITDLQNQQDK
jgi:hypothetical protein